MPGGVTVEELYSVGAFLPESELQKAASGSDNDSNDKNDPNQDDAAALNLPFASEALENYRNLMTLDDNPESLDSLPSVESWWKAVQEALHNASQTSPRFAQELEEFAKTGRSNGRAMQYARMAIAPSKSFVLHAHPNVEIIYVVQGVLCERRLQSSYLEEEAADEIELGDMYPNDLSQCPQEAFDTRTFSKGQVLLNEVGSVHRSYTLSEEGAELFLLWGAGGHCDVPTPYTPESELVDSQRMEQQHDVPRNIVDPNNKEANNCSAWIANALVDAGVKVVYGGHGGALAPLVNAIVDRQPELHWVCCRNETNASLMAAAQAKYTGRLACVIATSGPGATNLTTGLMEATLDHVPVLCLTGLKPRQGMHYSEFQDVDQSRLFAAAGCEFSNDVASPEALIPLLRDAVAVATTRNTCAHLAIPVDIQAAPCPIDARKHFCAAHASDRIAPHIHDGPCVIPEFVLNDIVDILSVETKKVLIAIGLRAVDAGEEILQLAEHLRAPIVTRLDSKGTVDELHPLVLGVEGVHGKPGLETSAMLMETADIVLNFGVDDCTLLVCNTAGLQVREMMEFTQTALLVSTRFRAVQTCLGDPAALARAVLDAFTQRGGRNFSTPRAMRLSLGSRDVSVSSNYSSMTEGTNEKDARMLMAQVGAIDLHPQDMSDDRLHRAAKLWSAVHSGAWIGSRRLNRLDSMEAALEESLHSDHKECSQDGFAKYPHPAHVLMEVSRHLNKDIAVCIDTGDVTLWGGLCLKLKGGSRTLTSEHLGCMGYSLCAGIASILSRDAPATSLVLAGDGGFQMTLQELATFQQHKRPGDRLIVIVLDNRLLGRVIFGFDGARGCELLGPDFCELAKTYGGHGYRLDDAEVIGQHVRDAEEGLTILHVPIDPKIKADMATFKDGATKMMNSG